jgi:hypothetical protein
MQPHDVCCHRLLVTAGFLVCAGRGVLHRRARQVVTVVVAGAKSQARLLPKLGEQEQRRVGTGAGKTRCGAACATRSVL